MSWPPKPGELLPRAGFAAILGITVESVDYLEAQICIGILNTPISSVRDNPPYGFNVVVEFPLRGVGGYRDRVVDLRTVWLVADGEACPRLLSAFPNT